jgi:YVTN family beta-propeller protein
MVNAFMTDISGSTYTANVIDTSNDKLLYPTGISLALAGANPVGVAITPDGLYAIIISQGSGRFDSGITVISTVTNQVVEYGSLSGPTGYAQCVATGQVGSSSYAYITYAYFNPGTNDEVLRFDFTNGPPNNFSSATHIGLGGPQLNPSGIAVTPNGNYVYVVNASGPGYPSYGSVSIIPTSTNSVPYPPYTFTTTNNNTPACVAITPDNATVYVTLQENTNNGQVAICAVGATVSGTPTYINVGKNPAGIAITPNVTGPQTVYVANAGDDTVSYFSTVSPSPALVSDPLGTFKNPGGLAITPDGAKVYVGNKGNKTISVISTATNAVTNVIDYTGGDALGIFIQQILNQDTTFAQGATSSWFGT